MKSKIIIPALLIGLQINVANAGLAATTVHSRANCINNESITWWLGHAYDWRVLALMSIFMAGIIILIQDTQLLGDKPPFIGMRLH